MGVNLVLETRNKVLKTWGNKTFHASTPTRFTRNTWEKSEEVGWKLVSKRFGRYEKGPQNCWGTQNKLETKNLFVGSYQNKGGGFGDLRPTFQVFFYKTKFYDNVEMPTPMTVICDRFCGRFSQRSDVKSSTENFKVARSYTIKFLKKLKFDFEKLLFPWFEGAFSGAGCTSPRWRSSSKFGESGETFAGGGDLATSETKLPRSLKIRSQSLESQIQIP